MKIQSTFVLIALASLSIQVLPARPKPRPSPGGKQAGQPQDEITIRAHLAAPKGKVTRFITTQHYSRLYVYAERDSGQSVMLLDLTRPDRPLVLSDSANSPVFPTESLIAVVGTAALASDSPSNPKPPAAQTIRIMDYSDPVHPQVKRQFDGVTALERTRGLILLANPEGIWILAEQPAEDPEIESEYARRVRYQ